MTKTLRVGARLMLAWAASVFPLQWQMAYAQGLPGEAPTKSQIEAARQGKGFEKQDEATTNTLVNKRAARLLRAQKDDSPLRGPRLLEDTTPVRTPKLTPTPGEAESATRAAAKIAPKTREQMVQDAQRGSNIGQSLYGGMDAANIAPVKTQAEPGVSQTTKSRTNLTEVMPGYNESEMAGLQAMGQAIYSNPEQAKTLAEQNRRNLRRDGCRKTDFVLLQRQTLSSAPSSPDHRILKVEFFDLVKEPIPGTNPVEYQTVTVPSTYKRGSINLAVETIGGGSTVWWDRVDDTYAIRYTYTPYTSPKGRNYFTYNQRLAVSNGAVSPLPNEYIVSYGTPKDGFKLVTGYTVPMGVRAVYLSADLYRTEVNYHKPADGVPCNPDPPSSCEVPSLGGDVIRWCPGSQGSNIALLYDDVNNPNERRIAKKYNDQIAANATRKDFSGDGQVAAGVIRGVNASKSNKVAELVGSCRRDSISRIEIEKGKPYQKPDIQLCSDTLVNPMPNGCKNIKRSFGLSSIGDHNFLTVKAFVKVKVPIIDPATGKQVKNKDGDPLFTYRKDPANVSGSIRTDFTLMGAAMCPAGDNCTTEKLPDDPLGGSEGYYVEYIHSPMGGDPKAFAFDGIYVQAGGTGSFSHYGLPSQNWLPAGSASGDGTLHELRLMAKAFTVPINTFAGCEKYMQYVADGFCKGAKLTCVDSSPTRTIGGVTFGLGMANSGIVEVLKKWGTDNSADFPDYSDGDSPDPLPTGPAIELLSDKMCWEAQGEPFTSCTTMDNNGSLTQFLKGSEIWATDCDVAADQEGTALDKSLLCKRVPEADSCDSRFNGLFTGVCYNETKTYDCGTEIESKVPVIVEEKGDSCSGTMRCLGTECHRPNLAGSHGGDFARAVSSMEAINFMVNEMVCAETGEPPETTTQACTPMVFGGKAMYCKIPIGHQIGLTPNCCKEARKAAAGGPSWIDYLQAAHALYNITRNETMQRWLANSDVYNSTSQMFGEISKPITDMYASASNWVTQNVVTPFRAGFDNLYAQFGGGAAGATPAGIGSDAVAKMPSISATIDGFKQMLMKNCYEVLKQIGGEDLAQMFFQKNAAGVLSLTQAMQNIMLAFQVYSILRLIGHIIFACKKEEYEWGMNDKWRLCTYVDSCCAKKFLVCLEKRQLYCCYKSIAARVISEQIIKKGLVARPFGYRTSLTGGRLKKCNINCGGFTALELSTVDWSRVDLTEWLDSLIEGGLFNPSDPRTNYGVSQNTVEPTMAVGRTQDTERKFDQRISAVKTVEGWAQNTDTLIQFTQTLKDEGEHCYEDNKKMPFTYPGCKREP